MRILRYIFVPWTALLVYSIFSFFLGQNGMFARAHLEREQQRILENEIKLDNTNAELIKTRDNLNNDQDSLSVYARQLGYSRGGERFMRIMGLVTASGTSKQAGEVLYAVDQDFVSNKTIAIISALFGLIVVLFLVVYGELERREAAANDRF